MNYYTRVKRFIRSASSEASGATGYIFTNVMSQVSELVQIYATFQFSFFSRFSNLFEFSKLDLMSGDTLDIY